MTTPTIKDRLHCCRVATVRVMEEQQRMNETVRNAFPIGTQIEVKNGQHAMAVEVTGYNDSQPGGLVGVGLHTGKSHSFHYSRIVAEETAACQQ